MFSRKIDDLIPELRPVAHEHIRRCAVAGIPIVITCTARTSIQQLALAAKGRAPIDVVNWLMERAGLPKITARENNLVTWTLDSMHIINPYDSTNGNDLARAYDVALLRNVDNNPHYDIKFDVNKNDIPDYLEVARIGESLGLVSGSSFPTPDWPHFQAPAVLSKLWKPK